MSKHIKSPSSPATQRILSITSHLKESLYPADDIQNAKMSTDYKFQGWMGLDKNADKGEMKWQEFEPKTWTEDDVDIKITHCGICGSDLHTLRSGWVGDLFNSEGNKSLTVSLGPHSLSMLRWPRNRWRSSQSWQERQAPQSWRPLRCRRAIRFLPRLRGMRCRLRALLPCRQRWYLQWQIQRWLEVIWWICGLLPCASTLRCQDPRRAEAFRRCAYAVRWYYRL